MTHTQTRTINDYRDMLDMERPVSRRHQPMSLQNRAAQFAPFAALTGYEELIDEESRYVAARIAPDDDDQASLNHAIADLREHIHEKPSVTVTRFIKDVRKEGGRYETFSGTVRRLDEVQRMLIMTDGKRLMLDELIRMTIDPPEK